MATVICSYLTMLFLNRLDRANLTTYPESSTHAIPNYRNSRYHSPPLCNNFKQSIWFILCLVLEGTVLCLMLISDLWIVKSKP